MFSASLRSLLFCSWLIIALAISIPAVVSADTLADVMNSKSYRLSNKMKKKQPKKDSQNARWLPPGENFTKLFRDHEGMYLLLDWIGAKGVTMISGEYNASRTGEYVTAYKQFISNSMIKVDMHILVPHPKYAVTAEINLIPEFANLRPPGLKIEYSEEVMVKEHRATIYERAKGGCSMVIPIDREGLIDFSVEHCSQKQSMLDLAGQLDYERLSEKLNS